MQIAEILHTEYLEIIATATISILFMQLKHKLSKKRGVFSYFVENNIVGISDHHPTFGNVEVKWENHVINQLYLSTIHLKNESLTDFEDVVIRVFTSDTNLLNESSQISGMTGYLKWTQDYNDELKGLNSDAEKQLQHYHSQREYLIPVFNRGQEIRIAFLNSANSDDAPNICLEAPVKGVKVIYQDRRDAISGVLRSHAHFFGAIIAIALSVITHQFVKEIWIVFAACSFGLVSVFFGVYAIKGYQKMREIIGG